MACCVCMNDSILSTVKKAIGIDPDCTHYDPDIIMHINTAFSILSQLGCGPEDGFSIDDDTYAWEDYLMDNKLLNMVPTYISLKVRLLFDPPASSFVLTAIQNQIKELEWRINHECDCNKPKEPIVIKFHEKGAE